MKKVGLYIAVVLLALIGCAGKAPQLGIEAGLFVPCPNKPNCVSSQAKDDKHFIAPIHTTKTQAQTKVHIQALLDAMPSIHILQIEHNYIRAEGVSKILGFVDDVEFYFPEIESKPQAQPLLIQLRSASRVGYADLGVNRKRLEKIRKHF